jgi:hypothetical protein
MHIIRHPLRSNAEDYSSKIMRLNQRKVIIGYPVAESCTTHHFAPSSWFGNSEYAFKCEPYGKILASAATKHFKQCHLKPVSL